MTVLPELQGQGLGRRLMNHALAWLNARGCRVVLLDATAKGAALYETMGFVDDSSAYDYARPAERRRLQRLQPAMYGRRVRPICRASWRSTPRGSAPNGKSCSPPCGRSTPTAASRPTTSRQAGRLPVRSRGGARPVGAATPTIASELLAAGLALLLEPANGHVAAIQPARDRVGRAIWVRAAAQLAAHGAWAASNRRASRNFCTASRASATAETAPAGRRHAHLSDRRTS